MRFTNEGRYAILKKVDVRCPNCRRLLLKAFVLAGDDEIPPATALAIEIKCERCKDLIGWPVLSLPAEE